MKQEAKIKIWFSDGQKPDVLYLVFNNDLDLTTQIDRWLKANLKDVKGWEFV